MHKSFYASGFIYHSPTQQILLQQSNSEGQLILFQCKNTHKDEPPSEVFQRYIESVLHIKVSSVSVHPVYDYVHNKLGEHFIFYVEVADIVPEKYSSKNNAEWFSLSKLSKIGMSEQTRHDIIIGERVINSLTDAEKPQTDAAHY